VQIASQVLEGIVVPALQLLAERAHEVSGYF
jgi:hypothetical protein